MAYNTQKVIENHFSHFEAQLAKKRKGLWEEDEHIRFKMKELCYAYEKQWFSLFYNHGVNCPQNYVSDGMFAYEVLKRHCYETFGKNIFTLEEFELDPHFQALFETKNETELNEPLVNYHKHLLFSESRLVNEYYESGKGDRIEEVTSFFDQLRTMDEEFLHDRDGFGMYRTLFVTNDEGIHLHYNLEEYRQFISFETFPLNNTATNSFRRINTLHDSIIRSATKELQQWAAKELSFAYSFDKFGFYSRVNEDTITISLSYQGESIIVITDTNGVIMRVNGDIVYNIDTLVRELFEHTQAHILGREQVQLRASSHFNSTLSSRDIIGNDYVCLTGENFDYIIFNNQDIIRVEKNKPLTPEFVHLLCIHPKSPDIPRYDGYATLSMMIKAGMEKMINQIANTHKLTNLEKIKNVYSGACL